MLLVSACLSLQGGAAPAQTQEVLLATDVTELSNAQAEKLEQQATQFIESLAAQDFAKVRDSLHPDLKPEWPQPKIEGIWLELLQATGTYKEHGEPRVIPTIAGNLVNVPVTFENTTSVFLVVFNQDDQIVGVDFPKMESIETIAEKVVDALAQNDFASARGYLHPTLKQDIFPAQAQAKWQALLQRTGPFQKRLDTQLRPGSAVDNIALVTITLEFEKVTEPLFVILMMRSEFSTLTSPD